MNQLPDNHEIRDTLRPFYGLLERAHLIGWHDALAMAAIPGYVRRVERATLVHAGVRAALRDLADEMPGFLRLKEEPEGKGLDYLVVSLGGVEVGLRWGRLKDGLVRRNATVRQGEMQAQGYLFGDVETLIEDLPVVCLGHEVGDDFYEAGQPRWRLERLALVRERRDASEFIEDVAVYSPAIVMPDTNAVAAPRIEIRSREVAELRRAAASVRSKIA